MPRCPTCGGSSASDAYSCALCVASIPDPFAGQDDDEDGETYENRDFDYKAAIEDDFYA